MKTLMIAAMAAFAVGLSAAEANLALNKTVTSSSIQTKGMEAKNAVDGKKNTRWGSAFKDNQWIMVDLGSVQKVGKVVLTWEGAFAKEYKVQVSSDGKNFTTVATKKDGKGRIETISFPAKDAKFVRIQCDKRGTKFGNSLWELEVYAK